jgi:hypothetical protein
MLCKSGEDGTLSTIRIIKGREYFEGVETQ